MNEAKNQGREFAEDRGTSRTLGCVGFSMVVHASLLAALLIIPLTTMLNIGGENAGSRSSKDSDVSLIETTSGSTVSAVADAASAQAKSSNSAIMTDAKSDIVVSKTAVVKKEAEVIPLPEKSVAPKKAKAQKSKPIVKSAALVETSKEAEPTQDEAPVLLANPPSDNATEEKPEKDEAAKEDEKPTPVVAVVSKKKTEEKAQAEKEIAPVAAATDARLAQEKSEESSPSNGSAVAASDGGNSDDKEGNQTSGIANGNGNAENANGKEGDGAAAAALAGPVRDASELKALPGNPNPVYPARDRLAHKEGTSVIIGTISADGRVTGAQIERSSGSRDMDSASLQAFRSWRFQAGQQGRVRKPFQFRLVGDAKEVPAPLGKQMKR